MFVAKIKEIKPYNVKENPKMQKWTFIGLLLSNLSYFGIKILLTFKVGNIQLPIIEKVKFYTNIITADYFYKTITCF